MTTKKTTTKAKKTAVTAPAKVTTTKKRAVKRERVAMVKPTPSSPTPEVTLEAAAPAVVARPPEQVEVKPVDAKVVEQVVAQKPTPRIERAELEQLVRREAFKLAQRRQFRGGSPVDDWFAAERSVKAALSARGVSLPN